MNTNEKKTYFAPQCEVLRVQLEGVIASSSGPVPTPDPWDIFDM